MNNLEDRILDVPFKEKDEAKMLGARWNPDIKKWVVPTNISLRPFAKWLEGSRTGEEADAPRRNNKETHQDSR